MNASVARKIVVDSILDIAPEVDLDGIDPVGPLQEQASLDSMDFLGVLTLLEERCGVAFPDSDPALRTLDGLVRHLAEASGSRPG